MYKDELGYVRRLASQVYEFASSAEMDRRRTLWEDHNSLIRTRPLIYIRAYAGHEQPELVNLICTDSLLRHLESHFKHILYRKSLGDDFVFEPYFAVRAVYAHPSDWSCRWGPKISVRRPEQKGGAFMFDPPLRSKEDFALMKTPVHEINEDATTENFKKYNEILDNILPAVLDRSPLYMNWAADISTDLAYLCGLEGMMWMMCDEPEFLHKITDHMSAGVLAVQNAAETAGDYSYLSHENQAVPYARELHRPAAPERNVLVTREKLWAFCAAQESAVISPAMWEEFIFEKQYPIISKYGLVSYGCCEDMTYKIDILKKRLPNLRRIAVTPWADLEECAKKIGEDYVLSYRPSPTDMVASDFDGDRVKRNIHHAFEIAAEYGCHIDVTLKDVETVSGNTLAVPEFVKCVREVINEFAW